MWIGRLLQLPRGVVIEQERVHEVDSVAESKTLVSFFIRALFSSGAELSAKSLVHVSARILNPNLGYISLT